MDMTNQAAKSPSIAIIGGGVSGATAALYLSQQGYSVTLLEKGTELVSGPPICHLHAGGNLYREISTEQCLALLDQSIETINYYPDSVNVRPTVIAIPKSDPADPASLLPRLESITAHYQKLIKKSPENQRLGKPSQYFQLYTKPQLQALAQQQQPDLPTSNDEWLIPFAKYTDLNALKYPVVMVQEYGLSVFRLASTIELKLKALSNCSLFTNSQVTTIHRNDNHWSIEYDQDGKQYQIVADYLINAAGFKSGTIDQQIGVNCSRFVEFKAAYVTQWQCKENWPEVIFHGQRGTPQGMAQLTPYADGHFQLHGMTDNITLFKDGLASSSKRNPQPNLPTQLENKINNGWQPETIKQRTEAAIDHLSQYIPAFHTAQLASQPLFGAQQVPGNDPSLRAADVTFSMNNYARIEIVKASSALLSAKKIAIKLQQDFISPQPKEEINIPSKAINLRAEEIAISRGYPKALATKSTLFSYR
ncbi:FAD-binding oxidoreductase [Vibrio sp. SS-MA-C1-2]|uniref:FAD-dependent oxidoreductase n=1 Tax=Vibrio sp. SS-MA-C1-2 TaxID=2908646 RepID=UPI001F23A53D|nr:FAD-dependent oxidoreductase [Vibrio sp. SS-MA-C1-2]UJF17736.1 FAD-binding oxidoreductase [Vibrio sp. SS-MA-C1-2]